MSAIKVSYHGSEPEVWFDWWAVSKVRERSWSSSFKLFFASVRSYSDPERDITGPRPAGVSTFKTLHGPWFRHPSLTKMYLSITSDRPGPRSFTLSLVHLGWGEKWVDFLSSKSYPWISVEDQVALAIAEGWPWLFDPLLKLVRDNEADLKGKNARGGTSSAHSQTVMS